MAVEAGEWRLVEASSSGGYLSLTGFGIGPVPCAGDCTNGGLTAMVPPTAEPFYFGGIPYRSVMVASNGYVVPGAVAGPDILTPLNQELPEPAFPNNVIAPFWTALDLDGSDPADPGHGAVYVATGNFLGGDTFYLVVEWKDVQAAGLPGTSYSFQLWFELGTDQIRLAYGDLVGGLPAAMTVGVEDPLGNDGECRFHDGTGTQPATGVDLMVLAPTDWIFADGFESADPDAWSAMSP